MFNRFNKRSLGTKKFLKLTKTSSWVHCLRELGLKLKTHFYVAFPRKQSSSISRILTILWFFLDVKCLVMLEPSFELCRCENNHYVRLDDHVADVVDVVDVADVRQSDNHLSTNEEKNKILFFRLFKNHVFHRNLLKSRHYFLFTGMTWSCGPRGQGDKATATTSASATTAAATTASATTSKVADRSTTPSSSSSCLSRKRSLEPKSKSWTSTFQQKKLFLKTNPWRRITKLER